MYKSVKIAELHIRCAVIDLFTAVSKYQSNIKSRLHRCNTKLSVRRVRALIAPSSLGLEVFPTTARVLLPIHVLPLLVARPLRPTLTTHTIPTGPTVTHGTRSAHRPTAALYRQHLLTQVAQRRPAHGNAQLPQPVHQLLRVNSWRAAHGAHHLLLLATMHLWLVTRKLLRRLIEARLLLRRRLIEAGLLLWRLIKAGLLLRSLIKARLSLHPHTRTNLTRTHNKRSVQSQCIWIVHVYSAIVRFPVKEAATTSANSTATKLMSAATAVTANIEEANQNILHSKQYTG